VSVIRNEVIMRCLVLITVVAGVTACASAPSSGPGINMPTERTVAVDDQNVYRTTVLPNTKAAIPAAPSRAFEALKQVYAELEIPPGTNDPSTGRFGNTDFWKTRRLGGQAMSTYLSCGESFAGPAANNYRIYISLISMVRPDGKGASELETAFAAQAQNMEGTSGDRIPCGSTGRLEERIRKGLLLKLGTPGT
jgi:hypothetical protein